jgi:hypothetical protein
LWHLPEERARARKLLPEIGRGDLLKRLEKIAGNVAPERGRSGNQHKKRTAR